MALAQVLSDLKQREKLLLERSKQKGEAGGLTSKTRDLYTLLILIYANM